MIPGRRRFNPRLPGGRRPVAVASTLNSVTVSIHAFRGEGDGFGQHLDLIPGVSIHAFRGEGDVAVASTLNSVTVSIHAFRGEGDAGAGCHNTL